MPVARIPTDPPSDPAPPAFGDEPHGEDYPDRLRPLRDQRDRLDGLGRSGKERDLDRDEESPGDDLTKAEEACQRRDPAIAGTPDERHRNRGANRGGENECVTKVRHLLEVLGDERGMDPGAECDYESEEAGSSPDYFLLFRRNLQPPSRLPRNLRRTTSGFTSPKTIASWLALAAETPRLHSSSGRSAFPSAVRTARGKGSIPPRDGFARREARIRRRRGPDRRPRR
jgi:hypothetical protein